MSADHPRADSAVTDKLIGEVLAARYQIEQRIGEGAMGTVYKARHVKVGRTFAVKVLHPRLIIDGKVLQRFEREAELAGRLRHPNVIGVVDVGETPDGLRYMVMDFAEGPDLAALLGEAPMPAPRITNIVRQMLEGLFHAHEQGLIHRDFKPENVIVERDSHGEEVPRIVDFGIAILREGGDSTDGMGRLTTNGLVLGTPHYMAPEQAVADPIDHRIDLFALGIIIYEMLCGKLPFDGTGAEVARANLLLDPPLISQRVPYLEVDPLLEAFARRLMAKKRDQRPPTAKAARDLLDLIDRDRAAAAVALGVPPTAAARTPKTTEPATPRQPISNDHPGTFPPPIRELQAPTFDAPLAVAVPPRSREQLISTQVSDPMAYPTEQPPRRRGLVIGAITGGLVLVGAVIALVAGGSSKTPETPAKVAVVEPPPPTPAPPPPITKPVVTPIDPPAGSATTPTPMPAVTKPIAKPIAKRIAKPGDHKIETKPIELAPIETKPIAPVSAPSGNVDVSTFATQYKSIGAELKAFEQKYGEDAASDLQNQYRVIRFSEAVSTQSKRDAAAKILANIHATLLHKSR